MTDEKLYTCAVCKTDKPRPEIAGFYGSQSSPLCKKCRDRLADQTKRKEEK